MTKYLPYPEERLRADASAISRHFGFLSETGQVEDFLSLLDPNIPAAIIKAGSGGNGLDPQRIMKVATTETSVKELLSELSVIVVAASARLESEDDLPELLTRVSQSVSFEAEYYLKERYSPDELSHLPYSE